MQVLPMKKFRSSKETRKESDRRLLGSHGARYPSSLGSLLSLSATQLRDATSGDYVIQHRLRRDMHAVRAPGR